jgi:hypothetical protein
VGLNLYILTLQRAIIHLLRIQITNIPENVILIPAIAIIGLDIRDFAMEYRADGYGLKTLPQKEN